MYAPLKNLDAAPDEGLIESIEGQGLSGVRLACTGSYARDRDV
jgi:hypothetical protein